nr:MAG TPA: hypothetical protein [Caudoviricetes sp.]
MAVVSCTAEKVPGQRPGRAVNVSAKAIGHGWRNSEPAKRAGSERANIPAMWPELVHQPYRRLEPAKRTERYNQSMVLAYVFQMVRWWQCCRTVIASL